MLSMHSNIYTLTQGNFKWNPSIAYVAGGIVGERAQNKVLAALPYSLHLKCRQLRRLGAPWIFFTKDRLGLLDTAYKWNTCWFDSFSR